MNNTNATRFEPLINSSLLLSNGIVAKTSKMFSTRMLLCIFGVILGTVLIINGTVALMILGMVMSAASTYSILEISRLASAQSAQNAVRCAKVSLAVASSASNLDNIISAMVKAGIINESDAMNIAEECRVRHDELFSDVKANDNSIVESLSEYMGTIDSVAHALTEWFAGSALASYADESGTPELINSMYDAADDEELDDIISDSSMMVRIGEPELSSLALNGENYANNASVEDIKSAISAVDLSPLIINFALDANIFGDSEMGAA